MKKLFIAEKPSVARDIAQAIGGFKKVGGWLESDSSIITNGLGHLVEIFSSEMESASRLTTLPVLSEQFSLRPRKDAATQLALIKKLCFRNDVSLIVNACDAGREGELIFRLIIASCGIKKPIQRMWITSMTQDALLHAYRHLEDGKNYQNLYDAALCRTEADYLIGLNASKGISDCQSILARQKKFMRAGRVQTPVVALVVDREQAIKDFKPEPLWEAIGQFSLPGRAYEAKLKAISATAEGQDATTRFMDKKALDAILNKLNGGVVESAEDVSKEIRKAPPKLFSLSGLQKEAGKKFKFSIEKTLKITQALYETHKLVTYPRTGSDSLPEDYVPTVMDIFSRTLIAEPYKTLCADIASHGRIKAENKAIFDNGRITDHFAIIPAPGSQSDMSNLSDDEKRIYDLIVRQFIAAFYPDAVFKETVRTTKVAGETFVVSGKVQEAAGWMRVKEMASRNTDLCTLHPGELPRLDDIRVHEGKTTAPKRYDDVSLLSAMINAGSLVDDDELSLAMKGCGLGTEATRAGIISGLLATKTATGHPVEPYLIRDPKQGEFSPTEQAINLIRFCRTSGIEMITNPTLTGEWESKLSRVESGDIRRSEFMMGIRDQASRLITALKEVVGSDTGNEPLVVSGVCCPCCQGEVVGYYDHLGCKAGCGFRLYKKLFGRNFSDDEIKKLIVDKETPFFDDFESHKTGKRYTAKIVLKADGSPELFFRPNEEESTDIKCQCGANFKKIISSNPILKCNSCNISINMVIAKRKLSGEELTTLISTGYLSARQGYTSAKGKPFSAALSFDKKTGKITFSFDD